MATEWKETISGSGLLVVVTGTSASGKDAASQKMREHELLQVFNFSQVVTAASRPKRAHEVHGKDYWFYSLEQMREMEKNGMFIEPLTQTGGPEDWKATEKKEILPILQEKKNVIWRIDLSRAAEVARGGYFQNYLDIQTARLIESRTVVLRIDLDRNIDYEKLMSIRKERDGEGFNREKYEIRDRLEATILREHGHHFKNVIENKWNRLDDTVNEISNLLLGFLANSKNK